MVTNAGTITARDAGLAALVAPGVENSGLIRAELGTVVLAAGETHTVDFRGDGLISFALTTPTTATPRNADGEEAEALVENSGTVQADGGSVVMTASQASRVLDTAINMSGVAQANSVGVRNGRIVLGGGSAGRVRVSGTVRTQGGSAGTRGGTAHVTGEEISTESARIDASGIEGGGTVLVGGAERNQTLDPSSDVAYVQAGDLLTILIGENAGAAGDGVVPLAARTTIDADTQIDASSSQGNGGEVIIWGRDEVNFHGSINTLGGNNGFVEVSTFGSGAIAGQAQTGHFLVDPGDVCVTTGGSTANCAAGAAPISGTSIENTLNGGGIVEINTDVRGTNGTGRVDFGGTGSITVNNNTGMLGNFIIHAADTIDTREVVFASIGNTGTNYDWNAGSSLTLDPQTDADILLRLQAFDSGGGNLVLSAADEIYSSYRSPQSIVRSSGGDITMSAGRNVFILDVLESGGGTINLQAVNDVVLGNVPTSAGPINSGGGDITMNAEDDVSINGALQSGSGDIFITARSEIDVSESIQSGGGSVLLSADSRLRVETRSFSVFGASVISNGGNISLVSDRMTLPGEINAGSGDVRIQPLSTGQLIDLGGDDAFGALGLTDAELDFITAGTLRIGSTTAGSIDVTAAINPANVTTLSLITGDAITDSNTTGADITVANLALQAVTGIGSTETIETGVGAVAAANSTSGSIRLFQLTGSGDLVVGTVDGVVGVSNQATTGLSQTRILTEASDLIINSAVSSARDPLVLRAGGNSLLDNNAAVSTMAGFGVDLQASNMALEGGTVTAGSDGRVRIAPLFVGATVDLGSTSDAGAALELSDAELDTITAGTLQIGVTQLGDISLTDQIGLTNVNMLDLRTSGSVLDGTVTEQADLTVQNLVIRSGSGIVGLDTAVTNLAFANAGGAIDLSNSGALTIASLDGLTTTSTTGTTTDITSDTGLTFAVDTTSAGDADFNAPVLTVNNGVEVEVTAGTLALNGTTINLDGNLTASTITGTASTVNVIGSTGGAEIQDAVDVAGAGETVTVGDGSFAGGIAIDKALTMLGNGFTAPTIVNVPSGGAGFTVSSSNVTFDGFRFTGGGSANTVGIVLDGRNGTSGGAVSGITIGDTIGNIFSGRLGTGVLALGDVDTLSISGNTFGLNDGSVDQQDRITRGILSRVDRSGNNVIDGTGTILGRNDQGPFSDWLITDNTFNLRSVSSARGTAIDLEGASGTAANKFEISGNMINDSTYGIHVIGAGGSVSGAPYPLSNNILIDNNTINGLVSRGIGIRVGANIDSISDNNDRSRMSDIAITDNIVINTNTGIDVTGVTFMTMSDIAITGNTITIADVYGIRLCVAGRITALDPDWTGFLISGNDVNLGANGTGLLIDYKLDAEVTIGSGNTFDGGVNGLVINGDTNRTLTLVGDTLNNTVFTNQSGSFIALQDTALFDPDQPTIIDAQGVSFNGVLGSELTFAQALAVENQLVHYLDDPTLGLLNIGQLVVPNTNSIQLAVNAAALLGEDTVTVGSGIFGGSVEVWVDNLNLVGQGATTIINTGGIDLFANNGDINTGFVVGALDASGVNPNDPSGTANVRDVTIEGFAFAEITPDGDTTGIELGIRDLGGNSIADGATISGNIFTPTLFFGNSMLDAIELVNVGLNRTWDISNNLILAGAVSRHGIFMSDDNLGSGFLSITDNTIFAAEDGINIAGRLTDGGGGVDLLIENNAIIAGDDAVEFAGIINSGNDDTRNTGTGPQVLITGNRLFGGPSADNYGIVTSGLAGGDGLFAVVDNVGNILPGIRAGGGIGIGGAASDAFRAGDQIAAAGDALVDGARLVISGNDITGTDSDGIIVSGAIRSGLFDLAIGGQRTGERPLMLIGMDEQAAFNDGSRSLGGTGQLNFEGGNLGPATLSGNTIFGEDNGVLFNDLIAAADIYIGDEVDAGDSGEQVIAGFSNGIAFGGAIRATSNVRITDNTAILGGENGINVGRVIRNSSVAIEENGAIIGFENGVLFGGSVRNGSVSIDDNFAILGFLEDGIVFERAVRAGSAVSISRNTFIGGGDDGVDFQRAIRGGSDLVIQDNETIAGLDNGIFVRRIRNADVSIDGNTGIFGLFGNGVEVFRVRSGTLEITDNDTIFGADDGIVITRGLVEATVLIAENTDITGGDDGINIGFIRGGTFTVSENEVIEGLEGSGIEFDDEVSDNAFLFVLDNGLISGLEDGIEFDTTVTDSDVTLARNQLVGGRDGLSLRDLVTNSLVTTSANRIVGARNGINVDSLGDGSLLEVDLSDVSGGLNGLTVTGAGVSGASDVRLAHSAFTGGTQAGISVTTQFGGTGITTGFGPLVETTGVPSLAMSGPNQAILNNDISNVSFNSVGGGNFIELSNTALFQPGQPTIIPGLGATFDGLTVVPNLERATIDWIESRIIDFDDNPTLGQIFFFNLPYLFDVAFETRSVRTTNIQTPGDWIARPDFSYQILANNPLREDYPLGTCLVEVIDVDGTAVPLCINPAGQPDPSPSILRYLEGMEQLSMLQ
ncbi:MAG: beta strand repeat-containing protein [Cohaesibacteraceae bacterium]